MGSFFKQHLQKRLPALFLLAALLLLTGAVQKDSVFCDDCELLVLWNDSISEEEAAHRLSALCPELILTEHIDNFSVCRSSSPQMLQTQLAQLNTDASVRAAEPNHTISLCSLPTEAPYFNAQWALHNTGDYTYYINNLPIHRTATPDIDINLPEAYEILSAAPPTRPVTVAIIDTGIDTMHPALSGHIWTNPNEIPGNNIDDDNNGYVDDVFGWDFYNNDNTVCHYQASASEQFMADPSDNDNHGTHCAGIIAATEGVFGVAAGIDIRIMPLKIHGGEKNSGSISDAIKAIKYAQAAGADICNLSWGTTIYSETLETVMRESDMLFVVAAGNSGTNNNSLPLYPASYSLDNMISVAYITQSGELASDSNYGLSTVDIAAPGQDIYSTTVGGEYHYLSGTSMAAPVVSGISALLYAYSDSAYPQNVKELLLQTLKPLDALTGYVRYPGIPDAAKLLGALDSLAADTIAPTLSAATEYHETELKIVLSPEDLGGSGLRTLRYASGSLPVSYFRGGTIGQSVENNVLSLSKAGTYTFYVSDYAGNENVLVYSVQDDVTPPELSVSYTENRDGTFTVSVNATDAESGIKRLRYLSGNIPAAFFLSGGQELPLEAPAFLAAENTTYTIYTTDYRGNKTTYTRDILRQPAQSLFLNTLERTMQVEDTFRLLPLLLPYNATDYISYAVDDETLLYAANDGTITALATGTATVTISTSGGLSRQCTIHIIE